MKGELVGQIRSGEHFEHLASCFVFDMVLPRSSCTRDKDLDPGR